MKFKHILITFGFIAIGAIAVSQTNICFDYDASGNRIERIIDMSKSASISGTTSENEQKELIDKISELTVKVYPNPTTGMIKVAIFPFDGNITGNIQIYDINGRSVFRQEYLSSVNVVDLNNAKSGIYFLKIIYDKQSLEWKIVKQ